MLVLKAQQVVLRMQIPNKLFVYLVLPLGHEEGVLAGVLLLG